MNIHFGIIAEFSLCYTRTEGVAARVSPNCQRTRSLSQHVCRISLSKDDAIHGLQHSTDVDGYASYIVGIAIQECLAVTRAGRVFVVFTIAEAALPTQHPDCLSGIATAGAMCMLRVADFVQLSSLVSAPGSRYEKSSRTAYEQLRVVRPRLYNTLAGALILV